MTLANISCLGLGGARREGGAANRGRMYGGQNGSELND